MGFLKSITNAGTGFGFGSGFNTKIGGLFNDLSGTTASSNQAYRQNLALANLSNAYSERFAQNAHQWEMNDLQAAGLNPALTATGTSAGAIASAGGNANSGTTGTSSIDPIGIISALNQTSATKHSNSLQDNQGKFAHAQAIATIEMLPISKKEKEAFIKNLNANTKYTNERARGYENSDTNEVSVSNSSGVSVLGNGSNDAHTTTHKRSHSRKY